MSRRPKGRRFFFLFLDILLIVCYLLIMDNRGGKRPGAGAPKGNINRLKSGSRSKLLRSIVAMLNDSSQRKMLAEFVEAKQSQAGL